MGDPSIQGQPSQARFVKVEVDRLERWLGDQKKIYNRISTEYDLDKRKGEVKMTCVIQVFGVVGYECSEDPPQYLSMANINAHEGLGSASVTPNSNKALKFSDFKQAMKFWNQQSTIRPYREEGKPNKPLTALTVSIVNVE